MQFWHRRLKVQLFKKLRLNTLFSPLFKSLGKSVLSYLQNGVVVESFISFTVISSK